MVRKAKHASKKAKRNSLVFAVQTKQLAKKSFYSNQKEVSEVTVFRKNSKDLYDITYMTLHALLAIQIQSNQYSDKTPVTPGRGPHGDPTAS